MDLCLKLNINLYLKNVHCATCKNTKLIIYNTTNPKSLNI